jgi:predicted transposase YbfD/YdcC
MVTIPVSVGELIDKISILQIKKSKVTDDTKLAKIEKELSGLFKVAGPFLVNDSISVLYEDLIGVNSQLWTIEDKLRILEKEHKFDEEFISLARSVYHLNDERFSLKSKINVLTDSDIQEVKQYIDYK